MLHQTKEHSQKYRGERGGGGENKIKRRLKEGQIQMRLANT
jgi:hypothetical protein